MGANWERMRDKVVPATGPSEGSSATNGIGIYGFPCQYASIVVFVILKADVPVPPDFDSWSFTVPATVTLTYHEREAVWPWLAVTGTMTTEPVEMVAVAVPSASEPTIADPRSSASFDARKTNVPITIQLPSGRVRTA